MNVDNKGFSFMKSYIAVNIILNNAPKNAILYSLFAFNVNVFVNYAQRFAATRRWGLLALNFIRITEL